MVQESALRSPTKGHPQLVLLLSLVSFLFVIFLTSARAAEVTLAWDASSSSNLAGYKLYYGHSAGSYDLSVDVGNATSYTLSNLSDGEVYYIAATAYDAYGNESGYSEELVHVAGNKPPVADAGPDQVIPAGVTVTLSSSNSYDPDGAVASSSWAQTQGAAVALTDPNSAATTFTAPNADSAGETLVFSVTVTDAHGLTAVDTCMVTIVAANLPPVANAGLDQSAQELTIITLNGSASSDSDDGIAAYSWQQIGGPPVELTDGDLATPVFSAPDVGPEGASLIFQLTVTDYSGLQSTDTAVVNVTWVNAAPVANAGPDQSVKKGTLVTLNGSASSDSDDGIVSYRWRQTRGTPVTLSDPSAVTPSFTAPGSSRKTSLVFQLIVVDSQGLKSTDDCKVTVK